MKILLGDLIEELVRDTVFRLTILKENVHENCNDNDGHIQKFNCEVHNIFMLEDLLIHLDL